MGLLSELVQARQTAKSNSSGEEFEGNDFWGIYGSSLMAYNNDFDSILGSKIENIARNKPDFNCMDAFGEGEYIRNLIYLEHLGIKVNYGMSLTLKDLRTEQQRKFDEENKISMIEGNLFSGKTWAKVRERQSDLGIKGFDLIICRPLAGWSLDEYGGVPLKEVSLGLKYVIFNNLWQMLNSDGVLVSHLKYDEKLDGWLEKLRENSIEAKISKPKGGDGSTMLLKLVKRETNVDKLPMVV